MKYLDEYRDGEKVRQWGEAIRKITTKPWTLMEVCGGQTHAILRFGIDALFPPEIHLVHGPGCPVCVTPVDRVDKAIALAGNRDVILCSFGDMLRVPGSRQDLLSVKAAGGDIRIVYSPLDALRVAAQHPEKQVVFFAIGFETTVPATAMAVHQAAHQKLKNISFLVAHVLVPPAMEMILSSECQRVQGFLAPGHVCTVMGFEAYESLVRRFYIPIVITGFEPLDILQGVYGCIRQLENGRADLENQYRRSVRRRGNKKARDILRETFEPVSRMWRGIGTIPGSGLRLRSSYEFYDAERRFGLSSEVATFESEECIAGLVLQGIKRPDDCPSFKTRCTPDHPHGAPMVSGEGACAAYFRYRGRGIAHE